MNTDHHTPTDTPRTDANLTYGKVLVPADFARTLERELTAAHATIETHRARLEEAEAKLKATDAMLHEKVIRLFRVESTLTAHQAKAAELVRALEAVEKNIAGLDAIYADATQFSCECGKSESCRHCSRWERADSRMWRAQKTVAAALASYAASGDGERSAPTAPANEGGEKCDDGSCVKYRNINGGCDLCGAPCL